VLLRATSSSAAHQHQPRLLVVKRLDRAEYRADVRQVEQREPQQPGVVQHCAVRLGGINPRVLGQIASVRLRQLARLALASSLRRELHRYFDRRDPQHRRDQELRRRPGAPDP
jgi:hypothetical protein